MALTDEQRDALESLPMRSPQSIWSREGLIIYPTIVQSRYKPLLKLALAEPKDLIDYGIEHGWSEFEMGRILGAAQFMSMAGYLVEEPDN